MEKDLDLYKATLDEIVFEDRNKSYGGYFLRVWYDKNVTKAAIYTCSAFIIIALCINFYYDITAKPIEVFVPMEIQMDMVDEPLKEEEIAKLPPPPPKIEQPKIEEVKYLPPVIKPDKTVKKEEQMKELDSLLNSNISNKNVEGEKVKKFDFDEGDEQGQIGGTGIEKTDQVFTYVQSMPRFKGTSTDEESNIEIQKFIKRKLNYPEDAKQRKIQGYVFIRYFISKEGKVTNVEVVKGRGLDPSCDAEAIRIIKSMPDFIPGNQNGDARQVQIFQKIKFTLTN
jgi:protein TonB